MIGAETFALAHLAIIVGFLAWLAWSERRGRHTIHRWHRSVRYRHLSTEEAVRMIERATEPCKVGTMRNMVEGAPGHERSPSPKEREKSRVERFECI